MNFCFIFNNKRHNSTGKFKIIQSKISIHKWIFFLAILTLFSSSAFCQSSFNPKNAHYLWPTSASHALSSTFGETRAGHFHAALDIKTWGRRGYPVYATRSGILHRIAIGPTGYGKVIYLKHDDGSYSVYAHLLRFNKRLQHWADSVRFRDYSSSFDMIVDSLNIHVKQGEKIGISGASGIGPPHLHFELRTPNEEPFNPLRTNLTIKDTRTPLFSGLAVEPLSMHSEIEGKNQIYTKGVSRRRSSANFGTIKVSGPVGLAVQVFDRANGVHNAYAAYVIQMIIDGKQVFQSKVDQFSYADTHQMFLDRIYSLLQGYRNAYQRLYIADGNTLPFYQTSGNSGRLDLAPGRHQITIKASDYFGNTRLAELTLNVQKSAQKPLVYRQERNQHKNTKVDPMNWQWFHNWVNIPQDEFEQLTLFPVLSSFPGKRFYANGGSVSVNLKDNPQFYFHPKGQNYFVTRRVEPKGSAYVAAADQKAYASFPSGCFYDTTSIAVTHQEFSSDSIEVNVFPDDQPIAKSYQLSVKVDSAQLANPLLSFYQYNPENGHIFKLKTRRKDQYFTTSPSSLGIFMILADSTGPEIHHPRIAQRPDGQWLIYLPAEDNRSGIDYERTQIYVNGIRGLTEYEPEDDRLVYYHPQFVPQSKNSIKIIAYDYTGNKTVKEMTAYK